MLPSQSSTLAGQLTFGFETGNKCVKTAIPVLLRRGGLDGDYCAVIPFQCLKPSAGRQLLLNSKHLCPESSYRV